MKKKIGKYEYDFTEVFFENKNNKDGKNSKKIEKFYFFIRSRNFFQ